MYVLNGGKHLWLVKPSIDEKFWFDNARVGRSVWTAVLPGLFVLVLLGTFGVAAISDSKVGLGWLMLAMSTALLVVPIGYRLYARSRNRPLMQSGRVIDLENGVVGRGLRSLLFHDTPELDFRRQGDVIVASCEGYTYMIGYHPLNEFLSKPENRELLSLLGGVQYSEEARARVLKALLPEADSLIQFMEKFITSAQQDWDRYVSLLKRSEEVCVRVYFDEPKLAKAMNLAKASGEVGAKM